MANPTTLKRPGAVFKHRGVLDKYNNGSTETERETERERGLDDDDDGISVVEESYSLQFICTKRFVYYLFLFFFLFITVLEIKFMHL